MKTQARNAVRAAVDAVQTGTLVVSGIAATVVTSSFIGGLVVTAKTGKPPEGVFWTEVPAIGAGFIAVLCGALIASHAVTNHQMPLWMRLGLGSVWLAQLGALCTVLPVYLLASGRKESIPSTVAWIIENPAEGGTTLAIYMAIVIVVEIGYPGALIVLSFDSQQRAVVKERSVGLSDIQAEVLRIVGSYGVPLTLASIRGDLERLGKDAKNIGNVTKALVKRGKLIKDGIGPSATFALATEEVTS